MVKAVEVQEVDENLELEESQEEETSYEDAFEAEWGDKKAESEESEDPNASEEEPAEETEEAEEVKEEEEQEAPAAAAEPVTPTPVEPDDPYKWINDLPEDLRAEAEKLKNIAGSHQGRATAFQRRVHDLQLEVDRMSQSRRPQTADSQKSDDNSASTSAAQKLPKEWKQLQEDFPEFAEAVDKIRESDRAAFEQQLEEKLEPIQQDRIAQQKRDFQAEVSSAAEDIFDTENTGLLWTDVVQSDDFRAWLEIQPKSVKTAAQTPDPAEAIHVLRSYESDYQAAVATHEAESKPPVESDTKTPNNADKVKSKRKKIKEKNVTPGSKPVATEPSEVGGDYEAQFNAMWGKSKS